MQEKFIKCSLEEIKEMLTRHVLTFSSPIESFFESHIIGAEHFMILVDGNKVGYFSIFERKLLVQFYVEKEYRHLSQEIFYQVRKMQYVQEAFVPTCDEFLLAHVMDSYSQLERQAYFFQDSGRVIEEGKLDREIAIRLAETGDGELVLENSGKFFDNLENIQKMIANEQLYVVSKNGEVVGFGVMEKGRVLPGYASIGMYVVEKYRQQGVGRNILVRLKEEVYRMGLSPTAGCWYYNHYSKRSLESAGMCSQTRLLRVKF